uniref:Replication protein A1 n=1 Tax=Solanum tuberosum TaxID=4113 RepID=M1DU65_SOLTU
MPYQSYPYTLTANVNIVTLISLGDKDSSKLFNKLIETWKDSLKLNKSYYIAKGHLDRVNPNYSSVHKEVELAFTDSTIIKETEHEVPIDKFSYGFSSLEQADQLPNSAILDLICILVSVNPLIENENSKRREIVVTNELMEHTIVTLWEDFTGNDGAFLEKLQDDKPILALCDVRVSIYKGIDSVLYVFINYKLTIVVVSKCLNGPATLG